MDAVDNVSKFAHETADKIGNSASAAAEALSEKGEQILDAEQRMMKNCRGYVRDYPIASLGIAAAAGFLLSRLLSSR